MNQSNNHFSIIWCCEDHFQKRAWLNGRAADSRSEGWGFNSLRPQFLSFSKFLDNFFVFLVSFYSLLFPFHSIFCFFWWMAIGSFRWIKEYNNSKFPKIYFGFRWNSFSSYWWDSMNIHRMRLIHCILPICINTLFIFFK